MARARLSSVDKKASNCFRNVAHLFVTHPRPNRQTQRRICNLLRNREVASLVSQFFIAFLKMGWHGIMNQRANSMLVEVLGEFITATGAHNEQMVDVS